MIILGSFQGFPAFPVVAKKAVSLTTRLCHVDQQMLTLSLIGSVYIELCKWAFHSVGMMVLCKNRT